MPDRAARTAARTAQREAPSPLGPRAAPVADARRLLRRAGREQEGLFLAEGLQAVTEALRLAAGRSMPAEPDVVVRVFATPDAARRHPSLVAEAHRLRVPVLSVTDAAAAALSETVTPQGLVAVAALRRPALSDVAGRRPRLVAVLADVRDPGNAGTVIRAADAAGADAVVLSGDSVDPYNGKCVRASAGSVFHLPLVTGVGLEEAVEALRSAGCRVLAADSAAQHDLDTALDDGRLGGPTAWLFGNEAHGLGTKRSVADQVLRVPIYGLAESLNVAAAAAVCLFASARAQRVDRRAPPVIQPDR